MEEWESETYLESLPNLRLVEEKIGRGGWREDLQMVKIGRSTSRKYTNSGRL